MNERREEKLTTADVVAAAERRSRADVEGEGTRVESPAAGGTAAGEHPQAEAQAVALFSADEAQGFRSRWDAIQTGFVDEPRRAVEQADSLVAEVMKHLAQVFADERTKLEGHWSRGDNVSTEDLRVALQRYRSFFDRLLRYGAADVEPPAAAPVQRAAAARPGEGPTERWEDEVPRLRTRWEERYGARGGRWEEYEPCYRYAWEMQHNPQYRGRSWPEVEPDLRRDWERRHPDQPWDRAAEAVRNAWEDVTGAPSRR